MLLYRLPASRVAGGLDAHPHDKVQTTLRSLSSAPWWAAGGLWCQCHLLDYQCRTASNSKVASEKTCSIQLRRHVPLLGHSLGLPRCLSREGRIVT